MRSTDSGTSPRCCADPHGEILLRRAAGIFDELRQAVDELGSLTDASRGELHIGGTPTTCAGLLPRIIGSVRASAPDSISTSQNLNPTSWVAKFSPKFSISPRSHRGAGHANELGHSTDCSTIDSSSSREQHPLTGRRSVAFEEAADHQWVLPATGSSVTLQLRDAFRQRGLDLPQPTVTTMSIPSI